MCFYSPVNGIFVHCNDKLQSLKWLDHGISDDSINSITVTKKWFLDVINSREGGGGGGDTWYILGWGGVARPLIPWPFLGQFLIACLRHLTRNHSLCKTIINIDTHLIHWQSQNYLQLNQLSREELLALSTQYTSSSTFIIFHFSQRWTRFYGL